MNNDEAIFCTGKNHKMERFLEVCLLLVLYEAPGYGYGLMEDLESFGFMKDELNAGSMYRVLRKMEKENLVTSLWQESDQGPKRRIYEITDSGRRDLENWIDILKLRKTRIETLIDKFNEISKLSR